MRPLDFICIGAPKAGTTSLHFALLQHPEICLPKGKEIPKFLGVHSTDMIHYIWSTEMVKYYSSRSSCKLYGKITPQYWYDYFLPKYLKRAFPNIKVILLLRDPVSRIISEYKMFYRHNVINYNFCDFIKEGMDILKQKEAIRHPQNIYKYLPQHAILGSFYSYRIIKAYDIFGVNNVHIVIFEDLLKFPEQELSNIISFLGLSPKVLQLPKRNTSNINPLLGRFAQILHNIYINAINITPLRLVFKKMFYKNKYSFLFWLSENRIAQNIDKIKISSKCVKQLYEYYSWDIRESSKILGRNLPWPEYNDEK